MRRAAVIGLGTMGVGIARMLVEHGLSVSVYDERPMAAEHLDRNGLGGLSPSTTIAECVGDADIVFEAVFEDIEVKKKVLQQISAATSAVIASNTSTFVPSSLSPAVRAPERFLIAHFFNPAEVIPLVEVVPGPATDPEVVDAVYSALSSWGKHPVRLSRECVGFVANRLQAAVLRESLSLIEEGIVSAAEIDDVVINALGPRWAAAGPIGVADLGGLDIFTAVCAQIFPTLSSTTTPSAELLDRVAGGDLGAKSGRGFYEHDEKKDLETQQTILSLLALCRS